jgi:hypothetical protein
MKHCIFTFVSIFTLYTLCGCKEQPGRTETGSVINADIDKRDPVSVFDIFRKIEIIPLETTDESLIKNINKLIYYDNKFYILDYSAYKIFVFDSQGNYLFKIDDRGPGPEQYTHIADFDVDGKENKLMLLSAVDAKLHEYNSNGQFVRKYSLPDITGAYEEIKCVNADTIAFWTYDHENRLKFYSKKENKIFKESFPEDDHIFAKCPAFPENKYNYLTRAIDNRILKFSPVDDMVTAYTWDFGGLNIDYRSLNYQKEGRGDVLRELFKKMYASEIVNYLFRVTGENSDYLYTQIVRKNKYVNIFHDKKKQQTVVFEKTTENAYFFPLYWTDDFVICHQYQPEGVALPSVDLEEIIPDAILDDENIERKKRYNEFDNPILVKYCFKK